MADQAPAQPKTEIPSLWRSYWGALFLSPQPFQALSGARGNLWFGVRFFLLVMLTRASLAMQLRRWAHEGRLVRKAILIGDTAEASAVARQFARADGSHIEICGLFDDRAEPRDPHAAASSLPVLGSTAEAAAYARSAGIDGRTRNNRWANRPAMPNQTIT